MVKDITTVWDCPFVKVKIVGFTVTWLANIFLAGFNCPARSTFNMFKFKVDPTLFVNWTFTVLVSPGKPTIETGVGEMLKLVKSTALTKLNPKNNTINKLIMKLLFILITPHNIDICLIFRYVITI